jgi:hypothetical protein
MDLDELNEKLGERWEKIRYALNTLLESNNLTEDEKELVKELFTNTETKYEVDGIDTETLGDVLCELKEVAENIMVLYDLDSDGIVFKAPSAYSDTVRSGTRRAIEHYNEAMKGLSRYVKDMEYKPIQLG